VKRGWQTKKLGDVCRFIDYRGKTPEKTTSGLRLVTAKNVKMGYLQETPREFVAPKSYDGWMTRGIPKMGDVIFTTEAPLANVAQLDTEEKVVFAQRIIVLQPSENSLDRTFLKYLLLSDLAQHRIHEKGTGATVKGIKASLLKSIPIEFPPLLEQQRIVGILDEAFEGIATAKANAEKNLHNARALFESHLQSVFTQRGEGWEETTLEHVLSVQPRNGWSPPAINHSNSGVPVLTLSSVTGFQFRASKIKFTSAKADPRRHYWVKNGDFLITRSNTPELVGHVAIAAGITEPTIYPDLIMRMTPSLDRILTEFLYYQMRTPSLRLEITGRAQGANPTMKKISKGAVQSLPIAVPPLSRQKEIVAQLDALAAETQRLESLYQQKLAALYALKKSLLHQAFTGQL
jgi:type I restriction enzyme S subunit